jgi:hypothetical protein
VLSVELFGHHEVLQVFVVSPNLRFALGSLQEMLPLFQCTDDGQHFLIMNLVVLFHCIEALGVEGNRVLFAIRVQQL